ncbi:transcription initiation factor IIE subunit beta [Penaeus vannamei]|uniref:Transcription initiation factor IIE subunit beta n=1 Tax=Penaeus vannamei TaxID=6689 RepID=A0A423SZE6_PENVA|nr:transcription initiation factor IIE subunit beta-like [Penaeus vannamei]XP_027222782.1 transcription initiation factor IIE subunit beta-like [Penaeus vannamei]ROT69388.1 transcription initiation factor IIE subunit beta [Penaeus vannamei]
MDRSLMKDRDAFLKRAMATPSVEVKKRKNDIPIPEPPKKKITKTVPSSDPGSYKSMTGGSQYKFGVLTRIVRHMKTRHQDGETHPLSLDEILDETNQLNAGPKVKQWLITEALPNNPKIQEIDGKYLFKPPLPVRDRKSMLKLLRQHDMKGHGGVLLDDIQESLPHCDKTMKMLDSEILRITRQTDKKQIIFYHDKGINFPVEKEFQQLWRNTSVDGLQDDNIEEYLNKQGIKSMQDTGPKIKPIRRKVKKGRQRATKISDNEHMQGVLQIYDDV